MNPKQVFISYSHRDNVEIDGARWVSAFRKNLETVLQQLDGGGTAMAWSDEQWRATHTLEGDLPVLLANTEILLPLLSPSYVQSRWCKRELEWFTSQFGGRTDGRVVAGEFRPCARDDLHALLKGLVPEKLWKSVAKPGAGATFAQPMAWPKGDDPEYWPAINALGHEIIARLAELSGCAKNARPSKVWIAAPTDDVRAHVKSLEGYLKQAGFTVVKAEAAVRMELGADAEKALAALLEDVDVFVQCFGQFAGGEFDDLNESVTALQHRVARQVAAARSKPLLTWRSPDLALDSIADEAYRALLVGSQACGFEVFKRQAADRLQQPEQPRRISDVPKVNPRETAVNWQQGSAGWGGSGLPPLICVSADKVDRQLGEDVLGLLGDLGVIAEPAPEPDEQPDTTTWRHQYEDKLVGADGLLVVCGGQRQSWAQSRFVESRKMILNRRASTVPGLIDLSAIDSQPLGIRLPPPYRVDCRSGLRPEPLQAFLQLVSKQMNGAAGVAND